VQTETVTLALEVDEDTSPPSFTDGLRASGRALGRLAAVLVLVAGALLPFAWLIPLVIGGRWWLRRRRTPTGDDRRPSPGPADPPAPASTPGGEPMDPPGPPPREPVGAPGAPRA
jgi:hypothetical protein